MSNFVKQIRLQMRSLADPERAEKSRGYFKSEAIASDEFLGISVPKIRLLVKEHPDLSFEELAAFLDSDIHEERLFGLLVMVRQFGKGSETRKQDIYRLFLRKIDRVNQWDLIDSSAPYIVGPYLKDRTKRKIYELAKSKNIWRRRIAMLSTFAYIREGVFEDALAIAELLLNDSEDLIHKAVGWGLREIGERDLLAEEAFLRRHAAIMPRTMLRYAIEKFTPSKRERYMKEKDKKRK